MTDDRELFVHKEWLGLIQPVGLVVTVPFGSRNVLERLQAKMTGRPFRPSTVIRSGPNRARLPVSE